MLVSTPRIAVGEISRFTVAAAAHRGGLAMVAVAFTAVVATDRAGLTAAVCLMSPGLWKALRRTGIRFTQLTGVVNHRGQRALFNLCPQRTLVEIHPDYRELFSVIRSGIEVPSQQSGFLKRCEAYSLR